ncbi:Fc.00g065260.m01.CDS01 [Cosmosporella sp. VM-42]
MYSDEDPSDIAQRAQKRITELKKARDERIRAIVAESETAMENLRTRVVAYKEERRMSKAKAWATPVMRMIEATERKMEVEARMEELVVQMNSKIREVEEMMKIGYHGRERDVKKVMEAGE